jgi:branched-chain amino acid transport system ATP-binding protein
MLLQAKDIHTYYGDSHVLDGITIEVAQGEIVAILGRNGVGKSTTLKSIMGIVEPREGSILFKGQQIKGRQPYHIARSGIGYVPEDRRVFPGLTVRENLIMGLKKGSGSGKDTRSRQAIDRIYSRFKQLEARDGTLGGSLSGGEQQLLTLARTLMGEPELMLIDEPSEGLSPIVADLVFAFIKEIHQQGVSVVLVDRNLNHTCRISQRVYIMVKGRVAYSGTGQETLENKDIQSRFLAV